MHHRLDRIEPQEQESWLLDARISTRYGAVGPRTPQGCEECLETHSRWVHLRLCLSCGHVGCCDDSPNKHATRHFHASHHPLIGSFEPGEDWGWCYVDELVLEPAPTAR